MTKLKENKILIKESRIKKKKEIESHIKKKKKKKKSNL
jgi:hypothetical protein